MAFDFPASPVNGQQFTPAGGPTYTFNGAGWTMGSGVHKIFVGDDPPVNPISGQLWWESDAGDLYVYYDDGDSQQWVQVNMGMALLAGYLPLTGGTLSGNLSIDKLNPAIILNKQGSPQNAAIYGQYLGKNRFNIDVADNVADPNDGSNTGSRFKINRYNDAGNYIDSPLYIDRDTGITNISDGIKFGAQSSNAFALDYYVEGTFTPTITVGGASTGAVYSTRAGVYTRIGNMITFGLDVIATTKPSGTGVFQVGGLPFTAAQILGLSIGYYSGLNLSSALPLYSLAAGGVSMNFYYGGTGAPTQLTDAHILNGVRMCVGGSYLI